MKEPKTYILTQFLYLILLLHMLVHSFWLVHLPLQSNARHTASITNKV